MDSKSIPLPTPLVDCLPAAQPSPSSSVCFCNPKYENGTTATGFILNNEGVVVALDHSRASGEFPENVTLLNSHLLVAVSGGTKFECKLLLSILETKCQIYELVEGRKASAAEASMMLSDFLSGHPCSDEGLPLGILLAGWENELGPQLYRVDAKGELCPDKLLLATGSVSFDSSASGSVSFDRCATGTPRFERFLAFCLTYSRVPDTRATELARDAVNHGSGECFSVFHVGTSGVTSWLYNEALDQSWRAVETADRGISLGINYTHMMNGGCGLKYRMGTALGFIFNDEVVTVSLDHSIKSNPENARLLNSHLLASVCGVDKFQCQGLVHFLQLKCWRFQLEEGRRASAAEASKWLADHLACNPCSDDALSLEVLIAGWDRESGPALYHVDAEGAMCSRPSFGSGSAAHGCAYFDPPDPFRFRSKRGSRKSARYNMSVTEAIELARDALCGGALLVPESREFCSVFNVGSDGVKHVLVNYDIRGWQEKYFHEHGEGEKSYITNFIKQRGQNHFIL